ncbi:CaiB/BaiF CoA transferase family protein [Thermodesulfobacteriota bacterium]
MTDTNEGSEIIEGQIFQPQAMALEGIRVIDLTMVGAGPEATRLLGHLGAEILKIEQPGVGEEMRRRALPPDIPKDAPPMPSFENCNLNKKSVTIDLHKEKGQEILHRLVAKADVFTANLLPKALKRFKVDYETLVKHNPKLVYVRGNVSGPYGPDASRPGYATNGNAVGGLLTLHDYFDTMGPIRTIGYAGDTLHALAMAYGVTVGIIARDRHGTGQEITLSQLGAIMNILLVPQMSSQLMWGKSRRGGLPRDKSLALMNWYKCKDGKWIMLGLRDILSDKARREDWHRICAALGKPELEHDPRFKDWQSMIKNNEELIRVLDDIFITRTRAEWDASFREAGVVWFCCVNELGDLPGDPQVLANNYVWDVDHPEYGKIKMPGHPVTFTKTPATIRSFAPELGQHTDEVLADILGHSRDELAKLRKEGVI